MQTCGLCCELCTLTCCLKTITGDVTICKKNYKSPSIHYVTNVLFCNAVSFVQRAPVPRYRLLVLPCLPHLNRTTSVNSLLVRRKANKRASESSHCESQCWVQQGACTPVAYVSSSDRYVWIVCRIVCTCVGESKRDIVVHFFINVRLYHQLKRVFACKQHSTSSFDVCTSRRCLLRRLRPL